MGYKQTLFPFMADVMLKCYIQGEKEDMRAVYDTYKHTGMSYTNFVINVYVPDHAKLWHKHNMNKYFDSIDDVVKENEYRRT